MTESLNIGKSSNHHLGGKHKLIESLIFWLSLLKKGIHSKILASYDAYNIDQQVTQGGRNCYLPVGSSCWFISLVKKTRHNFTTFSHFVSEINRFLNEVFSWERGKLPNDPDCPSVIVLFYILTQKKTINMAFIALLLNIKQHGLTITWDQEVEDLRE